MAPALNLSGSRAPLHSHASSFVSAGMTGSGRDLARPTSAIAAVLSFAVCEAPVAVVTAIFQFDDRPRNRWLPEGPFHERACETSRARGSRTRRRNVDWNFSDCAVLSCKLTTSGFFTNPEGREDLPWSSFAISPCSEGAFSSLQSSSMTQLCLPDLRRTASPIWSNSGCQAPCCGQRRFSSSSGLMIVAGFLTRLTSLGFAGFCLLTALIFHRDLADVTELIQFGKDFGLAGGFLFLAVAGAGS
jgi:hypothetical protein